MGIGSSTNKYKLLLVTKPENQAQIFIVFDITDPALQDKLQGANTLVQGIGTTNKPIKKGDKVVVRTQSAQGGGIDVTFDVYRGNAAISTFSFVKK